MLLFILFLFRNLWNPCLLYTLMLEEKKDDAD